MSVQNKNSQTSKYDKTLITRSNSSSFISEQYRIIRTNIQFLPGDKNKRVILLSSPDKGSGKSTTVANLAVSIALQNDKVLLIDANLRSPVIHEIFDIPNKVGLTELLLNKSEFKDVVYKSEIGKLDILTSGSLTSNPAELLQTESMTDVLEQISDQYNVILIDSPNVLKSTETRVLANLCDGVVLVINQRKTKIAKLVETRKLLNLVDAELVGAIVKGK